MLLKQANLGLENVFAAWYSSILLFSSTLFSLTCFFLDRQFFTKGWKALLNYGWLVLAGCFAVLSFDEMGSIHEYIGDYQAFKTTGDILIKEENASWTLFYYLIGLVSLFMLLFSLIRVKSSRKAFFFLIAGIACYLTNPLQENFEIENYGSGVARRPVYFLLIEEGSELLGSVCFLVSTCGYAVFANSKLYNKIQPGAIKIVLDINKARIRMCLLILVILFGALWGLVIYLFGYVEGKNQTGVPGNWIPSVLAFLVSAYFLYIGAVINNNRKIYIILSVVALAFSIYYGCNGFAGLLSS